MMNGSFHSNDHESDAAEGAASDSFRAKPFVPVEPEPIPGFHSFGHIALQGVDNARDLGGLPSMTGKRIRKDRLLRSGELHHATNDDLAVLREGHRLAAVFDLRTQFETKQNPDPILELPGIEYIHESVLPEDEVISGSFTDIPSDLHVMQEFRHDAEKYMKDLYIKCVMTESGQSSYARFFQLLLNTSQGAVLWHCTQGKDRTGIAAYLVEYVLGVSEEDRIRDYLATNLYMGGWLTSFEERLRHAHLLADLDLDIEVYTYATLGHLNAALSAVVDGFGSLDRYIEEALGVTTEQRLQLQDMYLE